MEDKEIEVLEVGGRSPTFDKVSEIRPNYHQIEASYVEFRDEGVLTTISMPNISPQELEAFQGPAYIGLKSLACGILIIYCKLGEDLVFESPFNAKGVQESSLDWDLDEILERELFLMTSMVLVESTNGKILGLRKGTINRRATAFLLENLKRQTAYPVDRGIESEDVFNHRQKYPDVKKGFASCDVTCRIGTQEG